MWKAVVVQDGRLQASFAIYVNDIIELDTTPVYRRLGIKGIAVIHLRKLLQGAAERRSHESRSIRAISICNNARSRLSDRALK